MHTFDEILYRLMEEMEYVEWYCKHLLEVATIDGQEYVFNDLSLTNDDLAESNANKLGIKKNVFKYELDDNYNNVAPKLNYDALWKLSLYLYQYIYLYPLAVENLPHIDEYMKLVIYAEENENDINALQFYSPKAKNSLVIENKKLINILMKSIWNEAKTILNNEDYESFDFENVTLKPAKDVVNKTTLDWAFVQELSLFFISYMGEKKLSSSIKNVIITILKVFNNEVFDKRDSALNVRYTKMKYDATKGRIIANQYFIHEHQIYKGNPLGYTYVRNPESLKIRRKFKEMLDNYRKRT
jgi:hypothetical protein